MKIELLNPYVIKILIALRKKDSISSISRRIGLSYGWTYKWIKELVKEGILKEKWRGIVLQEENETYKKILEFLKNSKDVSFYYSVLKLFGIDYCLTKTDAVYIWTEGGYNIARYRDYYPIFLKIKRADYPIFLEYCKKLDLKINSKKSIFYSLDILEDFEYVKHRGYNVDLLNKTISFMKSNIYNFEPALEIISEMYKTDLKIKYKEAKLL